MKQTLFLISFISITFLIQAQNVFVGPTVGFGHSWITNLGGNEQFHSSWNAGISSLFKTNSRFSLEADVKFSKEGAKEVFNESPNDGPTHAVHTVNLNYIQIPIKLMHFFGKPASTIQPKIYLGPDFRFTASEKTDLNYLKAKNFDLGGVVGAGLNFKVEHAIWITSDVCYYNGFRNISFNGIDNYNRNLQLNIGLLMSLKKK